MLQEETLFKKKKKAKKKQIVFVELWRRGRIFRLRRSCGIICNFMMKRNVMSAAQLCFFSVVLCNTRGLGAPCAWRDIKNSFNQSFTCWNLPGNSTYRQKKQQHETVQQVHRKRNLFDYTHYFNSCRFTYLLTALALGDRFSSLSPPLLVPAVTSYTSPLRQ